MTEQSPIGAAGRFGGPQPLRRVEDGRLLRGEGRFAANQPDRPGQLFAVFVRSPLPHAAIRSVDLGAATAMAGVVAAWSGRDLAAAGVEPLSFQLPLKRADGQPMQPPPRWPLAVDVAGYVGEAVAVVVAQTRQAAQDAAEAVAVDYEERPHVTAIEPAVRPDAPQLSPTAPGNVVAEFAFGDAARVREIFAAAHHVTRLRLVQNRLVPAAMEPRASLAEIEAGTGRVVLHTCTQNPTAVRQFLAERVLRRPVEDVRVVVGDIGGGFGMKSHLYPEDAVVAFAAQRLQRPVRWRCERSEEFLAGTQGRDQISEAELALDGEGRILALRVDTLANVGASLAPASAAVPLLLGPKVMTSVYDVPAVHIRGRAVLTNTATVAPYRGAGRPEAVYLMERLVETAAREMGFDPVEFRRRNLIARDAFPYRNQTGETYDCGDPGHMLDACIARADPGGYEARRAEAAARGKLYGRGFGLYIEWTGANQFAEKVTCLVSADGHVEVRSATQAMGQGLETVYTEIAARALGIDPARIRILQGDTDLVQGFGSMASRSLFTGGSAVQVCAGRVIEEGRKRAAELLEAAEGDIEYRGGVFRIAGTDRALDLFDIAGRSPDRLWTVAHTNTVAGGTWPNGCHYCEVEIDPDTGAVRVARYATADDVGRPMNRTVVLGQLHGGIAQGLGQVLLEHCIYDPGSGQLLTGSFMDYAMPRADSLPNFDCSLDDSVPTGNNPLGAKGCGESGTVGSLATAMNAIVDALSARGIRHLDMPATPERVWRSLNAS